MQMKAALLTAYGDTPLELADVPMPEPGAGEVLIRIAVSALNPFDHLLHAGYMAAQVPLELPAVLGGDAAGTIAMVGAGVTAFGVGDRVIADFAPNGHGAQAEYGVVPVSAIARLPDSLGFIQGATLPKAGLMGRQAVEALHVSAGDRVLVSGALGAVGRAAIQYLRELGAVAVAGVRPERLAEGRALTAEALDITVAPGISKFQYAISAAAPVAANTIAHVLDGGHVASIVAVPEGANAGARVHVHELYHHTDAATLLAVVRAAARGDLVIPIAARFPLHRINDAYAALCAGPAGKIILEHLESAKETTMNDKTPSQTVSNRNTSNQNTAKGWTIALWIAQIALAVVYLMAGGMKLTQPISALAAAGMGFVLALPEVFVRFIGLAEVLGAIGVVAPALTRIRPSLTPLAAGGLALLQVCAAIFHVSRGEFFMLPANTALFAIALFVLWGRSRKAPVRSR